MKISAANCYANFGDLLQQQSWDLGWLHQSLTTNAIKISLASQGNIKDTFISHFSSIALLLEPYKRWTLEKSIKLNSFLKKSEVVSLVSIVF